MLDGVLSDFLPVPGSTGLRRCEELAETMRRLAHSPETAKDAIRYEGLTILLSEKAPNFPSWLKLATKPWGFPTTDPGYWNDQCVGLRYRIEMQIVAKKFEDHLRAFEATQLEARQLREDLLDKLAERVEIGPPITGAGFKPFRRLNQRRAAQTIKRVSRGGI